MVHAKFLRNQSTGSGEEDFKRAFTIYLVPDASCQVSLKLV